MAAGWGVDRGDAAGGTGSVLSTDHGALTGLTDDDHSQYLLLAGRSGGQIVRGGTGASDNLTLRSTSNATKGNILLADEGGNVIVGGGATASRFRLMEPSGSGTNYTEFVAQAQAANVTYTLPSAAPTAATGQYLTANTSGDLSWAYITELAPASGTAVTVGGGAAASELRFLEPSGSGSNYTAIKAQAQAGNITYTLPAANATNGVLLNDGSGGLSWDTNISDLIDHGTTTGLTDDDHTQYALLAGRSTGQILRGGTAASETLTLRGTSHSTVGIVALNDLGGHVTVGGGTAASELRFLEPSGGGTSYTGFKAPALAGNVVYTLPTADGSAGQALKTDGAGALSWGAAGGGSSTLTVTQASHGFSVGNVLYLNSSTYTLADADAAATAEVVGIVTEVTDANTFVLTTGGPVTGLSASFTAGTVYFLSGTAGALTSTEPSTVGQISKPLFIAHSTSGGFWFNMRGQTVGSATSTLAVAQASGDGSTTAFSLPATPVSENNVFVTISGVAQHKDTFSVSGSTLTFSAAPPTGTNNIEFTVVGSVSIGTPGDGTVTNAKLAPGALFTLAAEQASTSGTAIDFTGIPSGVQMIVVMLEGVSTNGAGYLSCQIGDSGGVETTGYNSNAAWSDTGGAGAAVTAGFAVTAAQSAATAVNGFITLMLKDATNNTWIQSGTIGYGGSGFVALSGGSKSLSGTLDRVRFTSGNPDTFDAGSISIMYR